MNDNMKPLDILKLYHQAMMKADIPCLKGILSDQYQMVHITGYVQPGEEWLGVVQSKQYVYHDIATQDAKATVDDTGKMATVVGKGIFDATINGMRAPWPLSFNMTMKLCDNRWIITHSTYTSSSR